MAVDIMMPKKKQDTSIGRRLFAMAAPVAGGMLGGPAGAAIGGALGSKMTGGSTEDALMSGAQAGISQGLAPKGAPGAGPEGLDLSQKLQKPELGSQFSRRSAALSQDPQMAVAEGLSLVNQLPVGHPLREELTKPLVQAQMLGQASKYKMYGR